MDAFYSHKALASHGKVQPGRDVTLVSCKKTIWRVQIRCENLVRRQMQA